MGFGAAGARVGERDGSVGGGAEGEDGWCVSEDGGSVASEDGEEFGGAPGGRGCGDDVGYGGVDGDG